MSVWFKKKRKEVFFYFVLIFGWAIVTQSVFAKDGNGDKGKEDTAAFTAASNAKSPVAEELKELKQAVDAQVKQFAEHGQQLEEERTALKSELDRIAAIEEKLGVTPDTLAAASAVATSASSAATPASPSAPQSSQQPGSQINIVTPEHPLSFKIGNADFTPGGFIDLTGIFRSTDLGSGLGTSFTSLPYNNTLPQGKVSEFRETSQGSRISLKIDTNVGQSTAVTGYIESDFNGYVPPNANQSTNSDSMRLRLAWAQIRHGKWEILGGQSWSLLTPTRYGVSPLPADIFTTLRVDSNYVAGLVYARQTGGRFVYHPTKWWAIAASVENPDQFVPSSVYLPGGSTGIFINQFDSGSSSTVPASTSTNTAIPNVRPDFIVKTAFDWNPWGHAFHLDVAGVVRSFKDYQNIATPADTNSVTGQAGSVNLNFEVLHGFHLIANSFYGEGGGRYIGALGPDVVIKPDGALSPVRSGSGIAGFEWQATSKLLFDGYYSGAYFDRDYYLTNSTLGTKVGTNYYLGFGYPGSPNTNNRAYQEGTFGVVPTIWSSPNYGKLQFIAQTSYVVRSPWYVAPGAPKNAHAILTYVDLRYIIP